MIEVTRHRETDTAARLREKARELRRTASVDRSHGMTRAAERQGVMADGLDELARLVEWAPFESERHGPATLARVVARRVYPERRA